MNTRCYWCRNTEIETEYHDTEWGVPVHDDRKHFEFIVLDSMQAGLSWVTILKKRENFRAAFVDFDHKKVATFGDDDIERLMNDKGIIRNRAKIIATIQNAAAFSKIQAEFGSFDAYVWRFVGGKTIHNSWPTHGDIPAVSDESKAMSKDLKSRGFNFVGPTICYAYMQAAGMVNDHTTDCYRWAELKG